MHRKTISVVVLLGLVLSACSALNATNNEDRTATLVADFLAQTAEASTNSGIHTTSPQGSQSGQSDTNNSPSSASTPEPEPVRLPPDSVWYAPNFASADFTQLFIDPNAWSSARSEVDVFQFYTQSVLNDPCAICGDNLLDAFVEVGAFQKLKDWHILVSLEVGAVKEWGCTGQRGYEVADFVIQNVENNGGEVAILAMDEPRLYGEAPKCSYTVPKIAERTAFFINKVHVTYPTILVGDIEPYPHYSVQELEQWIIELESQGVELAFFHLDVDVERVRAEGQNVVADLNELSQFCEEHGIPFGVIFTSNWRHASSDTAYYQSTTQWVNIVNEAIGRPQHVIFQSWQGPSTNGLHSVPTNLPENDPNIYSHTRLILDGLAILKP